MANVVVKLICFDRIKLLESNSFVKYPEIRFVYDSLVPTPLRVGFSNLFFKNSKDEIFEINDNESFWTFINLEYPKAKTHINKIPVIVISVVVKNLDYIDSYGLPIHKFIICAVCDREIAGIRYKCAICNDYNLCQYCERKKIHDSSHVMLRFARPNDNNSRTFLNMLHQLQIRRSGSKNKEVDVFDLDLKEASSINHSSDITEDSKSSNLSEESVKRMEETVEYLDNPIETIKNIENKYKFLFPQNNNNQEKNIILSHNEIAHNIKQFIDCLNDLPHDIFAEIVDQNYSEIAFDCNKKNAFILLERFLSRQKYKEEAKNVISCSFLSPMKLLFLKIIIYIIISYFYLSLTLIFYGL